MSEALLHVWPPRKKLSLQWVLRFLHGLCRTMSYNQLQNVVSVSTPAHVQPQRVKENATRLWSVTGGRAGTVCGWSGVEGSTLGRWQSVFPCSDNKRPTERFLFLVLRIHHPLLPFLPLPLPLRLTPTAPGLWWEKETQALQKAKGSSVSDPRATCVQRTRV